MTTTNKPEVVAWRWRKPVVNDHGETVGGVWKLGGAPAFLPWWTNEPLVRLTDYEALRSDCDQQYDMKVKAREQRDEVVAKLSVLHAECEKLVEALEAVMEFGCDPKSNRGRWALKKAESALATLKAYRKGAES